VDALAAGKMIGTNREREQVVAASVAARAAASNRSMMISTSMAVLDPADAASARRRAGRFAVKTFFGGIGDESEEDGKILHPGDFYAPYKYAFCKIKKLLAQHGASLKDVVKMTIFVADKRFFLIDWVKSRGEECTGFDLPASALIGVSSFAWPHMLLEIQTAATKIRNRYSSS
jgi:2-iminobutanoate/2-iminopropanoate deaminase